MLSKFIIFTIVSIITTSNGYSFAQLSDSIEIESKLKEGNLIQSYLYFQETNMTFGEGNELCSQNDCLYEFEKTSFDDLFGDDSRTFSGTLKIENKKKSDTDSISYDYYKLSGTLNLINTDENPETGRKILIYEGNIVFELNDEISATKKIEYTSQVKLYQPDNKFELIGRSTE